MIKKIVNGISEVIARGYGLIGKNYICYACKADIGRFLPYRGGLKNVPHRMIELDVIGSDVDHFSCPRCRSHDRERHLLMYFDKFLVWDRVQKGRILHFAPERNLARQIKEYHPLEYIKADLYPVAADIQHEDITKLSFADNMFDLLIANHILEHVDDDAAALKEIFRVLKPGGLAILQTPYSTKLQTTFEDKAIIGAADRLQAYGQEDHVRLYGLDFFSKLECSGFISLVSTHEKILSNFDADLYGVNRREPFMCFQKPFSTAISI
jgi:predicted SAM-dependent methyltransferase